LVTKDTQLKKSYIPNDVEMEKKTLTSIVENVVNEDDPLYYRYNDAAN